MSALSARDVAIKFGVHYDRDFAVRFYLSAPQLFLLDRGLREAEGFETSDHGEGWSTFETREGGRWIGLAVNHDGSSLDERGPFFEISGEAWGDGDDRFDHTRPASELSLGERLIVASVAKRSFAAADEALAEVAP